MLTSKCFATQASTYLFDVLPNHQLSRTCTSCPAWRHPDLPEEVLDSQLAIPQWGNVYDARKKKDVHALHTKMFTVREALELLNKQMQQMPTHLYKMFTAYEALERAIAGLKPGQLITLEDYQVGSVRGPHLWRFGDNITVTLG